MRNDPPHRQGLALVGLRGTGKSTVGRILAERLGRTFADADVEIEAMLGRSIAAVFAEQGESAFRDCEERVLAELTTRQGAIVATGGGVVLRKTNRLRLRSFGFVVWLTADPLVLAERLRNDPRGFVGRPALTAGGTLAEIAEILEARAPLYRDVANAQVVTTQCSAEQVADAILDLWSRQPNDDQGGPLPIPEGT